MYYFGIARLFWDSGASMPEGISIASMELDIAGGEASWQSWIARTSKQESLESYKDLWHTVLTIRASGSESEEGFRLKKKLIIKAESYSMDGKPKGPRWSISYQNKSTWGSPRYRSRTVIEFVETAYPTKAPFGEWWRPILASLKPEGPLNRDLQVQVQPLTYRGRHEIANNLYARYEDYLD